MRELRGAGLVTVKYLETAEKEYGGLVHQGTPAATVREAQEGGPQSAGQLLTTRTRVPRVSALDLVRVGAVRHGERCVSGSNRG